MLLGRLVQKKIHLVEQDGAETWLTLCGRSARVQPDQSMVNFTGDNCCVYCAKVQRGNESLRERLGAA